MLIGLIGLLCGVSLLFKLTGLILKICGKFFGILLVAAGYILLGTIGASFLGLSVIVLVIFAIIGIISVCTDRPVKNI